MGLGMSVWYSNGYVRYDHLPAYSLPGEVRIASGILTASGLAPIDTLNKL
jgi:hypothetical protein